MVMNKNAIALLSGGLDSSIAVKMMIEQGITILAVNFTSPFCNCSPRREGCGYQARKIADEFGIPAHVIHKGMDYMRMLQHPPHGYGRGMNPCIDCRIYMFKKVKEMMPRTKASFIVTGEVLGQRPMSQYRKALQLIEKESSLEGLILRPLSAQHLPPTIPEREGIVDRKRLLSICGRSRRPQLELAKGMGIKDYACPAGGCLLTDKAIASRLRDLFSYVPDYSMTDLHILRFGRHFRLNPGLKIVLGRDLAENEQIELLAKSRFVLFRPVEFRGPTTLATGPLDRPAEQMIGAIIARYSQDEKSKYLIQKQVLGVSEFFLVEKKFPRGALEALRIGQ
jgi:tRNA-specific 2-thiouridylase